MLRLIRIVLLVSTLLVYLTSKSQENIHVNWSVINEKTEDISNYSKHFEGRNVSYIFKNSKNKFIKYNPFSILLGSLLYTYQKIISDQLFTNCSYKVSCSDFAKNAIYKYGMFKGIPLSADRLMRCNKQSFLELSNEDIDFKSEKILDDLSKYKL